VAAAASVYKKRDGESVIQPHPETRAELLEITQTGRRLIPVDAPRTPRVLCNSQLSTPAATPVVSPRRLRSSDGTSQGRSFAW